jgi:hypothetical protein
MSGSARPRPLGRDRTGPSLDGPHSPLSFGSVLRWMTVACRRFCRTRLYRAPSNRLSQSVPSVAATPAHALAVPTRPRPSGRYNTSPCLPEKPGLALAIPPKRGSEPGRGASAFGRPLVAHDAGDGALRRRQRPPCTATGASARHAHATLPVQHLGRPEEQTPKEIGLATGGSGRPEARATGAGDHHADRQCRRSSALPAPPQAWP